MVVYHEIKPIVIYVHNLRVDPQCLLDGSLQQVIVFIEYYCIDLLLSWVAAVP